MNIKISQHNDNLTLKEAKASPSNDDPVTAAARNVPSSGKKKRKADGSDYGKDKSPQILDLDERRQ